MLRCSPHAPPCCQPAARLCPEDDASDLALAPDHRWPLDPWDLDPPVAESPWSSSSELGEGSVSPSDAGWQGSGDAMEGCWLEPLETPESLLVSHTDELAHHDAVAAWRTCAGKREDGHVACCWEGEEKPQGRAGTEASGSVLDLAEPYLLMAGPRKRRSWTEEERGAHRRACHGKSKMSLMQKLEIIELYETTTWMSQTEIAAIFGRSRSAISKILRPDSVRRLKQATTERGGVDVRRTRLPARGTREDRSPWEGEC